MDTNKKAEEYWLAWNSGNRDREDVSIFVLREGSFENALEIYRAFSEREGIVRDACLDYFAGKGFTEEGLENLIQLEAYRLRDIREMKVEDQRSFLYHLHAAVRFDLQKASGNNEDFNEDWLITCYKGLWGWRLLFRCKQDPRYGIGKVICKFGESSLKISEICYREDARVYIPSLARDLTPILNAGFNWDLTTEEISEELIAARGFEL